MLYGCGYRSQNSKLLDLHKAYLQVHVEKELFKYQPIKYDGQMYVMTRMGFGLSVAPKIMLSILRKVLNLDQRIASACHSYIDDIIVDEELILVETVRTHFKKYGLVTKDPVELKDAKA